MDGVLRLDGVKLLHHLGQAPGAQTGQQDYSQEIDGIWPKEGGEDTRHLAVDGGGVGDGGQTVQGLAKAPLGVEYRGDDHTDAHQHDAALDEIVDGRGHVAAGDHIDPRQDAHEDDADGVVDVESHAEEPG